MNINLTEEEFNFVLNTLAQKPYIEVASLINNLAQQAQEQNNGGGSESN